MKIQQPKKPEIRTKVDFLFERANILSKKPARKIGQKIKKKPTFEDKPGPKLVKNSHFLGQRWDHRSPYHLSTLDFPGWIPTIFGQNRLWAIKTGIQGPFVFKVTGGLGEFMGVTTKILVY